MAREQNSSKARTAEEGYAEALRRIKQASEEGATELDLSELNLTAVPQELGELKALKILELNCNQLAALPKELGELKALTHLFLYRNHLTALPKELGELKALTYLSLNNNRLTTVPKELGGLKALKVLLLHNNQLTAVPKELGELKALANLSLASNQLTAVPKKLGELKALRRLSLHGNQLTAVPKEFGELKALIRLYLGSNQLTIVPKELGGLKALQELTLNDNPLPDEILRLAGRTSDLLAYLGSLQASSDVSESGDPQCFNEAKLLLVGPGEVGKTWLLQALQGKVPTPTTSTKGIEIVREPLDILHPASGRTVHFNCWDFGGQDLYQVTQQIFFSPNSVYLLVWKPRPGFDPQLEQRLERIRISAGTTAKVFIVATHADENVPPAISEQALREKYGDLIPPDGFHRVDSRGGPNGTGIKQLRESIVNAAMGLSGMDVAYAPQWARAHKAIREVHEPSIPFAQFREICVQADMEESLARVLAIMMDVQGHVTYFDEAGGGDHLSGVTGDDNIVVRRPEWLAKAVAFVLEDPLTRDASGVLRHDRLKEIWARDEHRTCPGYPDKLHRYFLWLMWKFDIAYRQNESTSLLPELIDRGRPDADLRWNPLHSLPTGTRQSELICKVRQTLPDRMVSVLSAAAHPLRRIGDPQHKKDTLDRNWRTGFFLDTSRRGECFVELNEQSRELWLTARGDYPADLTRQLERTLSEVIKERWPNLKHEFSVPCLNQIGGKRCDGTFKRDFLENRRSGTVPCEQCERDWPVDSLLDGFEPGVEKIIELLKELKAGHDQLLVMALRTYRDLMNPHKHLIDRAPCMFTVLPEEIGGWNALAKLTQVRVRVTCWCEHPDGPHPNGFGTVEPMASYVIKSHQEWVRKAAPYINWAAMLLKAFVPLTGTVVKQGLGDMLPPSLGKEIDLMSDISKAIPTGKLDIDGQFVDQAFGLLRPEIVSLQQIQDAILDESNVKRSERWGGLRPVHTKTGEVLWLCERHAAIQSPPVPESLG